MSINTPTGWDEDLKVMIKDLTPDQKDALFEILKQDKKEREVTTREALYWNKEWLLKDLKENHVKIIENARSPINCHYGDEWRIFYIDLPSVWNFKWYEFKFYVSDWYVKKDDYERWFKEDDLLYSGEKIWGYWGPLRAIAEYMKESWVKMEAWEWSDCLKNITGLNNWYRSKDGDQFGFGKKYKNNRGDRGKLFVKVN